MTFNQFYFIEVMHLQMEGINEKNKERTMVKSGYRLPEQSTSMCVCVILLSKVWSQLRFLKYFKM